MPKTHIQNVEFFKKVTDIQTFRGTISEDIIFRAQSLA